MLESETVGKGSRSEFLMKLAYVLVESGRTIPETATLLEYADQRIGKFTGRDDARLQYADMAYKAFDKIGYRRDDSVLLSRQDILDSTDDLEWIIEGWLHTRGLMIISGQPGVGKTQLLLDMETHIVGGASNFLGKTIIPKEYKSLLISLEMQPNELKFPFKHQIEDASRAPFKDAMARNSRVYAPIEGFDSAVIETHIQQFKPDLLLIDSLSELFGEDISESTAKQTMRILRNLCLKYDLAIVMIHHNRKASDTNKKPNKLSDLYGSYIIAKSVETVLSLWEDEKTKELELIDTKTRFARNETRKVTRTKHLTFNLKQEEVKDAGGQYREAEGFVTGTPGINLGFD